MPTDTHNPRRILYVITDLQLGGVPLHLLRLARAVSERGSAVKVVSLAEPGPVSALLEEAGIDTSSCRARSPLDVRALLQLRRELRSFRAHIVHTFLFHANLACRLMGPLAGVPPRHIINEVQTVEISRKWHLLFDRWTHRLCKMEIGNSPSVVAHLRHVARLPQGKLYCIPGGVDIERFDGAVPYTRQELNVDSDGALLLWTGRLDPVKGLSDLLQAVAILKRQRGVHALLAGVGRQEAQLRAQVGELGLHHEVTLLGARRDVPRLLKSCDLFVFPSHAEGSPNALLEAMAAKRPIVCTDVPGNRDLITPGVHGMCCSAGDPGALAERIQLLLSDHQLARELAQNAHNRVRHGFGHEDMVKRYLSFYEAHFPRRDPVP